ncbi:hypothetical protein MXB_5309, partial [Myxobolus squamalis]
MSRFESESISLYDPSSKKKDEISLISSILLLAGAIIGTGIFMTPNNVVKEIPSIFYSLMTWVFCGVISLLAALCYAELGLAYPSVGGEYTYFNKIYHDIFSFTYLITNFFLIRPVCIAMLVLFFGEVSLAMIFDNSIEMFWTCRLISIVSIILICALNCFSERLTIILNDVLTYLKFICMAEFTSYPKGNLRILKILALSFHYLVILGVENLGNTTNVAQSVSFPYLGKYTAFITIMVALSALATANSFSYSGGNNSLYFEAAKQGHFPRLFAATHSKTNTYIPALIIQTIITIFFLAVTPNMDVLLMYFSGASWVFYSLVFAGVLIYRRDKSVTNSFRIWVIIPIVTCIISVLIVILGFFQNWVEALIS